MGGEILTFPDTPTTQGLSLWCFNTVERDFTDFARAPKVWCKDREVLMSLRNLFLLYFMTPACNFHGSGNDFMMYFVTPEHTPIPLFCEHLMRQSNEIVNGTHDGT